MASLPRSPTWCSGAPQKFGSSARGPSRPRRSRHRWACTQGPEAPLSSRRCCFRGSHRSSSSAHHQLRRCAERWSELVPHGELWAFWGCAGGCPAAHRSEDDALPSLPGAAPSRQSARLLRPRHPAAGRGGRRAAALPVLCRPLTPPAGGLRAVLRRHPALILQ